MRNAVFLITETTKSAWAAEDQAHLEELLEKRRKAIARIKKLVEYIDLQNVGSSDEIAELMAAHASQICEALMPFCGKYFSTKRNPNSGRSR